MPQPAWLTPPTPGVRPCTSHLLRLSKAPGAFHRDVAISTLVEGQPSVPGLETGSGIAETHGQGDRPNAHSPRPALRRAASSSLSRSKSKPPTWLGATRLTLGVQHPPVNQLTHVWQQGLTTRRGQPWWSLSDKTQWANTANRNNKA